MEINIDLNNKILVIPSNLKKKTIKFINDLPTLTNAKILTLNEFIKNLTFDYNEKTIYYLFKEKNLSYETTKEYLTNMKHILDNEINNNKLKNLNSLKNELIQNNLLVINNHFINYLKNHEIIFYGFSYLDRFTKKLIEMYNLKVNIIELPNKNINHEVYLFDTIEEEIEYIAEDIIEKELNLNKIYIFGINGDNINVIKRIFESFNLNINIPSDTNLYDTHIGKEFLNNLKSPLNYLKKISDQDIKNQITNIINKYYFVDNLEDIEELLKTELKKTKIKRKKLNNAINEIDIIDNIIEDEEYVYIINFNNEYIPNLLKDTDYISDKEKPCFLETSVEKNNINKKIIHETIQNIKNCTITASKNNNNGPLNISNIALDYNYDIINKEINYSTHSNKINKYNLCNMLDNYLKYNEENKNQEILLNTYKDLNYRTYNNKYNLVSYNKDINLSYSKISSYYSCPFKFYCENILKLKKYEDTFDTFLGSLCHYILSKIYDNNFNFEKAKEEFIRDSKYEQTLEDVLFTNKIMEELKEAIKYILSNQKITKFNSIECEKEIKININNKVFAGIIDKIQKYDNKIILIDYKTGNPSIDLELCKYGFNLQLPIYVYLIKQIYPDSQIVGVYLQHILKPNLNFKENTDSLDNYLETLKLQGYTISNEDIIEEIDSTYEKSTLIKNMKKTSNGFSRYAKLLSEDEFNKLENIAKQKIEECIENIDKSDFDIKPIILNGKNQSCPNCEFQSICHHTEKDYIYINNKEGENNAELD